MGSRSFQVVFIPAIQFGKLCFSFQHWRGTNFVNQRKFQISNQVWAYSCTALDETNKRFITLLKMTDS